MSDGIKLNPCLQCGGKAKLKIEKTKIWVDTVYGPNIQYKIYAMIQCPKCKNYMTEDSVQATIQSWNAGMEAEMPRCPLCQEHSELHIYDMKGTDGNEFYFIIQCSDCGMVRGGQKFHEVVKAFKSAKRKYLTKEEIDDARAVI